MSLSSQWKSGGRRSLLAWFARHGRSLPWRQTRDPYAIWVSEIMLQQTQVATVIDYYDRFLRRFPDVDTLAAADEQDVLSLWSGLGYYRRARQMHQAARVITEQFDGVFPKALTELQSLPGVGRYTAGAIASFAYDLKAPILEANTIRLFSRLMGLTDEVTKAESQHRLWAFAEQILPTRGGGSGQINQATMELGSLICLPQQPACHVCPITKICSAYQSGSQGSIPVLRPRAKFTWLRHALAIVRRGDRILLRRNPPEAGGWWQGLWDFPRVDVTSLLAEAHWKPAEFATYPRPAVEQALVGELLLDCRLGAFTRSLKHGVTRYRIVVDCFEATLGAASEGLGESPGDSQWRWYSLRQAKSQPLPLTSTAQRLLLHCG